MDHDRNWGPREAAIASLPGIVGGIHLVLLVAFLNPRLGLLAGTTLRLLWVAIPAGALLSTAAGWLLARRGVAVARAVPWLVAAELGLAAVVYASHASVYTYFLHPGVDRRLARAGVLLALLGLVAFYTALAHSLARRPYGPRSRLLLVLTALGAVWVAIERREAFLPAPVQTPPPNAIARGPELGLVTVLIDGLDLELLLPLIEGGELPFLAATLREGAYAPVEILRAADSAVQSAAFASGKLPYRTGAVGSRRWRLPGANEVVDLAPWPSGRVWLRPFGFRSEPREPSVLAFWGVWDALASSQSTHLAPETAQLYDLDQLRAADREIEASWLARGGMVERPSLLTIRLRGLELAVREPDGDPLNPAVLAHLRWIDGFLARVWSTRAPDDALALASSRSRAGEVGPDGEPRRCGPGLFALRGAAVTRGQIALSARAVDVAPTLLYLAGFPTARDLDGRARTDLLETAWLARHPLAVVPSYDFLVRRRR